MVATGTGKSSAFLCLDGCVRNENERDTLSAPVADEYFGRTPRDCISGIGYNITTPDKVIVIYGDCAPPSPAILQACNRFDLLVHEVYSTLFVEQRSPEAADYMRQFHTKQRSLGSLRSRSRKHWSCIICWQARQPMTNFLQRCSARMKARSWWRGTSKFTCDPAGGWTFPASVIEPGTRATPAC